MAYNKVELLRQRYPEGTRICVDRMGNDPDPIPSGTKGTVEFVDDIGTVFCKFDNDRSLGMIPGEDSFYVIQPEDFGMKTATRDALKGGTPQENAQICLLYTSDAADD